MTISHHNVSSKTALLLLLFHVSWHQSSDTGSDKDQDLRGRLVIIQGTGTQAYFKIFQAHGFPIFFAQHSTFHRSLLFQPLVPLVCVACPGQVGDHRSRWGPRQVLCQCAKRCRRLAPGVSHGPLHGDNGGGPAAMGAASDASPVVLGKMMIT